MLSVEGYGVQVAHGLWVCPCVPSCVGHAVPALLVTSTNLQTIFGNTFSLPCFSLWRLGERLRSLPLVHATAFLAIMRRYFEKIIMNDCSCHYFLFTLQSSIDVGVIVYEESEDV
jgi:hypothetical protein